MGEVAAPGRTIALLALLVLAACPVALPTAGQIAHACAGSTDCPSGQTCQNKVCATVLQDVGPGGDANIGDHFVRGDSTLVDRAAADLGQLDTAARDRSGADALASDHPDDGGVDANIGDAGAADRASADSAADAADLDTTLPDSSAPDAARLSCTAQFGSADGFILCAETATDCTYFKVLGRSCDQECQQFGARCLGGYADTANGCEWSGPVDCATSQGDGVCVCAR